MMSYPLLAPDAQPCVWMCAGLVSYRLCRHDFDCDTCPLDAALHRDLPPAPTWAEADPTGPMFLPSDRRYGSGHEWVRPVPRRAARYRTGLDSFAATLLTEVVGVRCRRPRHRLDRGDPICDLDLGWGTLSLGTPVSGCLVRVNPALRDRPSWIVDDPYGEGWIAELDDVVRDDFERLLDAAAAGARTPKDPKHPYTRTGDDR